MSRYARIWLTVLVIAAVFSLRGQSWGQEEEKEPAWKNTLKLGYIRTTGNSDTQAFTVRGDSALDLTPNRYFARGEGLYSEDNDRTTASHWFLDLRYERVFTERFFGFLSARYLKNTFAGYDSRINVGPGLGYEFIKTERHYLKGLASVLYTYENFSPPENGTDSYMSGRATGEYKWQILDNLAFKQLGEYQVSFEDTGVYFVVSETGLEAKVTDIVSVEFGYIVWYQGDPPADKDSTDTKFLTTLNFAYDLW